VKLAKGGVLTLIAGGLTTAVVLFFKDPPLARPEIVVVLAAALALVFGVNWLVSKLTRGR
jgi:flagellar biogenesis protein FliO